MTNALKEVSCNLHVWLAKAACTCGVKVPRMGRAAALAAARKPPGRCSSLAKAYSRLLMFCAVKSGSFLAASSATACSSSGPGLWSSVAKAHAVLACVHPKQKEWTVALQGLLKPHPAASSGPAAHSGPETLQHASFLMRLCELMLEAPINRPVWLRIATSIS